MTGATEQAAFPTGSPNKMETSTNQAETMDPLKKSLHRKVWERVTGLRMAEHLMNSQRLERQAALNRRLVRKAQNGTIGKATKEPEDAAEEDMGIHVGDIVIHQQPEHGTRSAVSPTAAGGPPSWLKTAGLVAAMGAAGAGGAYLPTLLAGKDQAPPPAVHHTDTDTDTRTDFELSQE